MRSNFTVSTLLAGYSIESAGFAGLDITPLVEAIRVEAEVLRDPDARISLESYLRLYPVAVKESGKPYFWLQEMHPEVISRNNIALIYYFNAKELREACRRMAAYYGLLNDAVQPAYLVHGDEVVLRITYVNPKVVISDEAVDFGLTQWWGALREFAGPGVTLRGLRLVGESPSRIQAYEDFYKVPVEGGHTFNELVFDKEVLDLPNRRKELDPNLDLVLDRLLKPALASLAVDNALERALFEAFQRNLIHGPPKLSTLARELGMSPRSLQRKLSAQGQSYSQLVQIYRYDLATTYLAQPEVNITEVALMVGYNKLSSFSAAFQKWSGIPPSEYRRLHQFKSRNRT